MSHTVVFTPEAEAQLVELYGYIATEASAAIAERFTGGIVLYCESLRTLSARGNRGDDIRPGLRITNYRKYVTIPFHVADEQINIIGVFYGARTMKPHCLKMNEKTTPHPGSRAF